MPDYYLCEEKEASATEETDVKKTHMVFTLFSGSAGKQTMEGDLDILALLGEGATDDELGALTPGELSSENIDEMILRGAQPFRGPTPLSDVTEPIATLEEGLEARGPDTAASRGIRGLLSDIASGDTTAQRSFKRWWDEPSILGRNSYDTAFGRITLPVDVGRVADMAGDYLKDAATPPGAGEGDVTGLKTPGWRLRATQSGLIAQDYGGKAQQLDQAFRNLSAKAGLDSGWGDKVVDLSKYYHAATMSLSELSKFSLPPAWNQIEQYLVKTNGATVNNLNNVYSTVRGMARHGQAIWIAGGVIKVTPQQMAMFKDAEAQAHANAKAWAEHHNYLGTVIANTWENALNPLSTFTGKNKSSDIIPNIAGKAGAVAQDILDVTMPSFWLADAVVNGVVGTIEDAVGVAMGKKTPHAQLPRPMTPQEVNQEAKAMSLMQLAEIKQYYTTVVAQLQEEVKNIMAAGKQAIGELRRRLNLSSAQAKAYLKWLFGGRGITVDRRGRYGTPLFGSRHPKEEFGTQLSSRYDSPFVGTAVQTGQGGMPAAPSYAPPPSPDQSL